MKRQTGHQQSLSDLWTNLSSDADLVAAEILWESHQEERSNLVNRVATGPRFQALCVALSNMLASSDNHLQRDAFRNVKAVLMHDRYCWDAMSSALVTAFEHTRSTHIAKVQREIWDLSLKRQNELSSRSWPLLTLYRHRSLDHGRYHLSHNIPFSRHPLDKCAACQKMGIWEAWRNSDEACRDDLYAGLDDILWLEIKPEAQFNAVGHHPVLAGINGRGQQEYIAHVRVEAELNPYPWCTATDGASAVTFWDEQGEERRTNHFWVLVLRYDLIEAVKQSVDTKGGIDATGPCYWLAGDMEDETYDANEIEDDLDREVDFNGDDDESIYSDEMSVDD
ncbi:hypothetical protein DFH11DRAFT_141171 [Phellopilus nigrolimitatus]|nr:hypothetical protein DFH11DRAFT_141171 [Phellopilus nigrolimitatus]